MAPSALRSVLLNLAIPVYVAPEEIAVGRTVFQNFVHDELVHEGLPDDLLEEEFGGGDANGFGDANFARAHSLVFENQSTSETLANAPEGYQRVVINQVGSNIRELAEEFARSRQREAIRQTADDVDLSAVNADTFWGLLDEVFKHGITSTNLIALFFFCSDVLIRCIRLKMRDLGMSLFRWSLNFIAERVCKWVHENGGWEIVLHKAFTNTKYYLGLAISVAAMGALGWFYLKQK